MMDRILNNLGLCQRASGLVAGEDMVTESVSSGKVFYLFIAKDASSNTIKKMLDKAKYYQIEYNMDYTSDELSHAIGKEHRMVIGITNKGFLKILKK